MKRPRTPSFALVDDDYSGCHSFGTPKRLRPQDGFDANSLLPTMDLDRDNNRSCDMDDWNALKELHALAIEVYEGTSPLDALPLLRRVLRESERFLSIYRDPSLVYAPAPVYSPRPSPPALPTSDALLSHDWDNDDAFSSPSSLLLTLEPTTDPSRPPEPITAFYTIYGSALFAFGTLIIRDPTIVQSDEVPTPGYYFARALDVMEVGENHPRRARQDGTVPEDFRLALTCGRTLVYLAEERLSGQPQRTLPAYADTLWPAESPFSAKSLPFPPRRLSLPRLGPSGILSLAVDQLMRGFLHMPHTHKQPLPNSPNSNFPRCRTLHTIGSEMLAIASKLPAASDRKQWAMWADRNAFAQMTFEADAEPWRPQLALARGKCCMVAAKASLHTLSSQLASGTPSALDTTEVADCADLLNKTVRHLTLASHTEDAPAVAQEARTLLLEAHEMLSNVPKEPDLRETSMDRSESTTRSPAVAATATAAAVRRRSLSARCRSIAASVVDLCTHA
ncbi:hypothetical protein EXIGLDRAFT_732372 [Exidia glandulosa HHB12029]|uniref:Uncharacterized protein n=1 Tax=Exidia glandulosa HHB12029 TaxID=1314781 RepID=A0A165KSG9_EXIGL|nr:hypothetical protein EXIGLDRAFT_732372 [Exidia glandulosa HHB12029]